LYAGKWLELEIIVLSEISKTQRKVCMFSLIYEIWGEGRHESRRETIRDVEGGIVLNYLTIP
jgi:hypothetical protein